MNQAKGQISAKALESNAVGPLGGFMRLRAMLLATAALITASCEETELCEDNCPDISGVYAIETINRFGSCSFNALTIGPTVVLQQSSDRRRVFAELIDPLNQLPVLVAADVSRLEDGEGGSFSGTMQLPRATDGGSEDLGRLWVSFSGSVQLVDGQRSLGALLMTQSLDDPCSENISFFGDGPFVP